MAGLVNKKNICDNYDLKGFLAVSGEPYWFDEKSVLLVISPVLAKGGENIIYFYDIKSGKIESELDLKPEIQKLTGVDNDDFFLYCISRNPFIHDGHAVFNKIPGME